jgi:hypothetical protein
MTTRPHNSKWCWWWDIKTRSKQIKSQIETTTSVWIDKELHCRQQRMVLPVLYVSARVEMKEKKIMMNDADQTKTAVEEGIVAVVNVMVKRHLVNVTLEN